MVVEKDSTVILDTSDVLRRSGIVGSEFQKMLKKENGIYEIMRGVAAPWAGGRTETPQVHDSNGHGRGIRRGVNGDFYNDINGRQYLGVGTGLTYSFGGGYAFISPGMQRIMVIALAKASTTTGVPQIRAFNTNDYTYSSDANGDGDWTNLDSVPQWYAMILPVESVNTVLRGIKLEIEVRLQQPADGTTVDFTLYNAFPGEFEDESQIVGR